MSAITSKNPVAITRTLFSPIFLLIRATSAQHVMVAIKSMGIRETQKFDFLLIRISVTTSSVRAASSWLEAPKTGHICQAVPVEAS
jgi:hypothetical protein